MKFLFDENMPPVIVEAMRPIASEDGDEVGHLLTKFKKGAKDVEWLSWLGERREWIVISRDGFNKTAEEKAEIVARSHCTFVLAKGFGNLGFWDLAGRLLLRWEAIRKVAKDSRVGIVYGVRTTSPRIEDITKKYL